jgi:hypothetical protein
VLRCTGYDGMNTLAYTGSWDCTPLAVSLPARLGWLVPSMASTAAQPQKHVCGSSTVESIAALLQRNRQPCKEVQAVSPNHWTEFA